MPKHADNYVTTENADTKVCLWLSSIRAQVAPRPRLQLNPPRCALLVIDMQRYFANPHGRCYLGATCAVIPRLKLLIGAWSGAGNPVIFTRHEHHGPEDLGTLGRFYSDYLHADEPDASIIEELAPPPTIPVVHKNTYDAFLATSLDQVLQGAGVSQVLVTGVLTHLCCETTARSAFCHGYEVYVAADATASSSEILHTGSLLSMADGVAVIMSTREILDRCATSNF